MSRVRKIRLWFDSSTGVLTEYTSDLNQGGLTRTREILEDTHLNEDDRGVCPGLRSASLPLNGYYTDSATVITDAINANLETSVSGTWQILFGSDYYNGEGYFAGFEPSGDGKALVTWSATLEVDGEVTRTSVAL